MSAQGESFVRRFAKRQSGDIEDRLEFIPSHIGDPGYDDKAPPGDPIEVVQVTPNGILPIAASDAQMAALQQAIAASKTAPPEPGPGVLDYAQIVGVKSSKPLRPLVVVSYGPTEHTLVVAVGTSMTEPMVASAIVPKRLMGTLLSVFEQLGVVVDLTVGGLSGRLSQARGNPASGRNSGRSVPDGRARGARGDPGEGVEPTGRRTHTRGRGRADSARRDQRADRSEGDAVPSAEEPAEAEGAVDAWKPDVTTRTFGS